MFLWADCPRQPDRGHQHPVKAAVLTSTHCTGLPSELVGKVTFPSRNAQWSSVSVIEIHLHTRRDTCQLTITKRVSNYSESDLRTMRFDYRFATVAAAVVTTT